MEGGAEQLNQVEDSAGKTFELRVKEAMKRGKIDIQFGERS